MKGNINKRGILLILLVVFLLVCGSVAAYMFRQTPAVTNKFDKAVVSCEVHETVNGADTVYKDGKVTAKTKDSITVKNTGNIDAYIRVKIVSHWEDASGNIVAKASVTPSFTAGSGWLPGGSSTYYYAAPVAAGEFTGNLLQEESRIILSKSEDGCYQVVEIFAEAIQADPVSAVQNSWDVTIESNTKKITELK